MSLQLATKLFENIGRNGIQHLRTFEFLKIIEQNSEPDGFSRITYKQWRDEHGLHAFILNCCVEESIKLGLLEVKRENRNGIGIDGDKGTKRIYKLILDADNNVSEPKAEPKTESPAVPTPEAAPEKKTEKPTSAIKPITFIKGKKVNQKKAKSTASKPAPKASPVKKASKSTSSSDLLESLPVKYRTGAPVRAGVSILKKKVGEFTKVPVPTSQKKTAKPSKK